MHDRQKLNFKNDQIVFFKQMIILIALNHETYIRNKSNILTKIECLFTNNKKNGRKEIKFNKQTK